MLRVTGVVGKYDSKPYSFTDDTGQPRSGVTRKARVVVGLADFVDVRIPDDQDAPSIGDRVDWGVSASPNGRDVKVTRLGDWSQLVPDSGRPPLRAAGASS